MAQPVTVYGIACMHAIDIDVNPGREIVLRICLVGQARET
jgi:hypothetical protein